MQKKDINEFITPDYGSLSSKMPPDTNAKGESHITSDKMMRMVAQPFVFVNYRRYYGEAELPYSEEADKFAKNPEKFYEFLKSKGAEKEFESYFTNEKPVEDKLKNVKKEKFIKMLEVILTKKDIENDVFSKDDGNLPTMDEVKDKNKLIFGHLDKILEFVKQNMDEKEKKLILSYIKENII